MANIVYFLLLALIVSIFLALLEIQIEGPHGWADKLPTWKKYFSNNPIFKLFFSQQRPLTGYHLYLFSLIYILLHFYLLVGQFEINKEFYLLSFFVLIVTLEDFFWFALNPHYGLKRFNLKNISWHPHWIIGVPSTYIIAIIVSIFFYELS